MSNIDYLLTRLSEMTVTFVEVADTISYEQIELFIEEREQVVREIEQELAKDGNLDEGQRSILSDVLGCDPIITARMEQLKTEAHNWLERNRKIKVQKNAYEMIGDYDSMFIDRKE